MKSKIARKISSQYQRYVRVWHLLKKPTFPEFKTISKVSIVGLLAIGALGFVISMIVKMILTAA